MRAGLPIEDGWTSHAAARLSERICRCCWHGLVSRSMLLLLPLLLLFLLKLVLMLLPLL